MVLLVTVLAIALRVAWVLLVPTKPVGDFAMYVESAAHLVQHGSFDAEFVYMPGYILLIAPVQALGGGWLATKLVGAVVGGLGAGAVAGIAQQISGGSKRAGLIAGLLCACWPAGIAAASVTGTDMPAAALVLVAAYFLWRFASARPLLAAILFGLLTGVAAYVRAIMVPLAVLSALVFRAAGQPWRRSLAHATLACGVALVMLSPWALRNQLRYGETFLTDSHGGLTALVGANPNTDGCYSRGLNRMFHDVTGFALLAEPHRQADQAALAIAKEWLAFDPLFTVGLLASKAERLLVHERALLYWPLFRASVLPEPERGFFVRHQAAIEAVADYFWLVVLALALSGCGIAYARRQWLALALLPPAAVLVALYTAIFSEPRYRMPIAMLLMPLSALALDWILTSARDLRRGSRSPSLKRQALLAATLPMVIFTLAPLLAFAGERLRANHGWAVHECQVAGQPRFCAWRGIERGGALDGQPGVRGVWNGVGIALPAASSTSPATVPAESRIPLAPGNYQLSMEMDVMRSASAESGMTETITLFADGMMIAPPLSVGDLPDAKHGEPPLAWKGTFHHESGPLRVGVRIEAQAGARPSAPGRVWLSNLRLEPEAAP